jgi:hypothetical protein
MTPAVTVTVKDAHGNIVTGYATGITLAIDNDPNLGTSVLTGGAATVPTSGVASFAHLQIDLTGVGFTLKATSGALTKTSSGFDIQ